MKLTRNKLKYSVEKSYRTLHPSFFFHFLDAKAKLCWPNKKVDTMLTLRLFLKNISPSHVLSRKEQSYPFFLWQIHKVLLSSCEATFLKWRDQPNVELQNGASNLLPKKRTSIEEWRNFFILWHSKCWRVRKTSRAYKLKVNVKRGFATFLLNLANQNMHYWFTNEIIFLKLTFGRVQNYSKKPFPTNQMTQ